MFEPCQGKVGNTRHSMPWSKNLTCKSAHGPVWPLLCPDEYLTFMFKKVEVLRKIGRVYSIAYQKVVPNIDIELLHISISKFWYCNENEYHYEHEMNKVEYVDK